MTSLHVYVEGIGLWSPRLGDFDALRTALAGGTPAATSAPAAALLPSNERRRAPESVRLAVEVAGQALAMSGRDPSTLACVFASAHGDQAITDAICNTLAQAPTELSPTRFHHSVHNVAAGYWTIATGCHAPSSAVCAGIHTFGAALLEAASQALAEQRPVLLACSDIPGRGPLREVTGEGHAFGSALVLAPTAGENTLATLRLRVTAERGPPTPATLVHETHDRPANAALPLLALLAAGRGSCRTGCTARADLLIAVEAAA